jgi:hypothetical protein
MVARDRYPEPAPRALRRRPGEPPVAHELLRLQRAAGNAAVARLVARRTLQRKIGFELEAGKWKSAWLDRDPQGDEEATGAVPHGVATQPPTARKAFFEEGVVRGTADELPGTDRDVEFVITEQDESQPGPIGDAFDKVEQAYDTMASRLSPQHWIWPEKRLGWKPPFDKRWLLDKADNSKTKVQLQATAGIPLDQLAPMFAHLDSQASQATDDPRQEASIHPDVHDNLAFAQAVADAAIEDLQQNHPSEKAFADAAKLRGLLALMAQMIDGGDPRGSTGAVFSYPKAIAAILPRTDFAALFGTLDPLQRQALAVTDSGQTFPRFVELIGTLCYQAGVGDIGKPLLGWSQWGQIPLGQIVPDLTRQTWAEGILAGQDRLSQTGYLAWLDARNQQGTVSSTDYANRTTESGQLDSLGSYHGKMDKQGNEDLPLVEFRALVDQAQSLEMTVAEAKAVGLRLAAYVAKLTARQVTWS